MCQLCFIYMVEDPRISISYYLKLQLVWGVAFLCPVFTLFKAFHRRLFFPVVGRHQPGVISTFAGGDKMWRQQSRPSITSPTHLPLPASTLIFHSSTPGLQSLCLALSLRLEIAGNLWWDDTRLISFWFLCQQFALRCFKGWGKSYLHVSFAHLKCTRGRPFIT